MADRSERLSRQPDAPAPVMATTAVEAGGAVCTSRRARRTAVLASAGLIVTLVSVAWFWQASGPPPSKPVARSSRLFTVAPTSLVSRLTIGGTVGAGKTIPVMAPFDGAVRERPAQLGDRVAAGDVLLVMDGGEVQSRYREAQASFLKTAMAVEVLNRWDTSSDVMRAKRMLETAEAGLAVFERQTTETKGLLDRGIVSRNEYDALIQQRDTQRVTVASGRQDLQTTLERGSSDNRRLAELELTNARARLADLQQQVDGGTVLAAAAGILARPPASQLAPAVAVVEPGSRVTRGQPLFIIADTATLVMAGKVDEVDVNRIRVGQSVSITSDAFPGDPIAGRVTSVSAEANGDQGSRVPSFDIRAAFSAEQATPRRGIRLGMSARMTIETRGSASAIVVPVEAVRGAPSAPMVRVHDPRSGQEIDRVVVPGATNESGVEILSGLDAGDVVVIP